LTATSAFAQTQQTAIPTANNISTVVPRLVRFSGTLLDERGSAMKEPVGVTFALYTEQSGGAALWMETQNVDPDSNGNYTVLLGAASAKGIPQELFVSGDARWLGVQVEGRAEQARVLLVSVPYALKAGDAETLGGLPPSAFAQAHTSLAEPSSTAPSSSLLFPVAAASTASVNASSDPNVTTAGGTVNFIPKFDTPSDIKTSQIFDNGTNVGIGFPLTPTPVPVAKLDINGKANVITVPDVIGNLPLCLNIAGRLLRTLGWPWQRDLYARTFRWAGSSPSSGHGRAYVDPTELEPEGRSAYAGSGQATMGQQHQGPDSISGRASRIFSLTVAGSFHLFKK